MRFRRIALGLALLCALETACGTATPPPPTVPAAAPTSEPLYVGNTGGIGVYLRRTRSLNDPLRAWCDGTPMVIVGPDGEGDGLTWKNVRDPDGTVGWIPSSFLVSPGASTPTPTLQCPTPAPSASPLPNDQVALLAAISEVVSLPAAQPTAQPLPVDQTRLLGKGDAVRVDTQGIGLLRFSDSLVVRIFRSSNLQIEGLVADGADAYHSLALQSGTIFNTETIQDKATRRVQVTTDSAVIDATGTQFLVYHDGQTGTTWIVVREGAVQVRAPTQTVAQAITVPAGYQTWVVRGQVPMSPRVASRSQIPSNLNLPSIDVLTNGELADGSSLGAPATPTETPTPTSTSSPIPSPTATPTATPTKGRVLRTTATPTATTSSRIFQRVPVTPTNTPGVPLGSAAPNVALG